MENEDVKFMKEALKEAQTAFEKDEIPVGCVVVSGGKIIARAHNLCEVLNDVTAHAEMQAITSAASYIGGKYLNECSVYITLEPCPMCAGALNWAQAKEIIFGASDEKRGFRKFNHQLLHPKTSVKSGIMANECSELLTAFFRKKRD
jgi:tRNA(adenine34) deaminase